MAIGYYRAPTGLLSGPTEPPTEPYADEAAARAALSAPAVAHPQGWSGTIGGSNTYIGGLSPTATQEEAEAYFRNDPRAGVSSSQGYMAPLTYLALNPNITPTELQNYQQTYNDRQSATHWSRGSMASRSGLGPLGIIGLGILAAAGGAAAVGALSGGGAAGAAGAAGASSGGAAGAAGAGAAGAGTAAGTAGAAGAGTAAGAGAASAIPEIVVTGSAGGMGAGGAAGAASGIYGAADAAASNTSALNASNEAYLSGLEAPTASYGIDWGALARQGAGALSQGQGGAQQPMPQMGGGLMGGGGGSVARGVPSHQTVVRRSPLENYMSRLGLLQGNK